MTKRNKPSQQRGFALLVVVLIVALIGVSAVALLDIVNVDLLIVGQHRRSVDVQAVALGAMEEVMGDQRLAPVTVWPMFNTPNLRYRYAGQTGANSPYFRDPNGNFAISPMDSTNSAYVKNLGTSAEEGYEADINLIRMGPPEDTGLNTARELTYEIRVVAALNGGEASKEVRATTSRRVGMNNGRQITPVHAR